MLTSFANKKGHFVPNITTSRASARRVAAQAAIAKSAQPLRGCYAILKTREPIGGQNNPNRFFITKAGQNAHK